MKKIGLRISAMGIAAALSFAFLGINVKPATAGDDEFWGAVIGATIGGLISGSGNRGERQNYSSHKVRQATKKMLIHYGLTPIDECTVNVVLVSIGDEQICAMPNHTYGPGTYRIHPHTYQLISFGLPRNGSPQPYANVPHSVQTPSPYGTINYPVQMPTPYRTINYPVQTLPQVRSGMHTGQSLSSLAANGSIYRLSGQPISPPVLAKLRSLLAGNNLGEAACGTTAQQVTITVNNDFVICGHPNSRYAPGNYRLTLNGLY